MNQPASSAGIRASVGGTALAAACLALMACSPEGGRISTTIHNMGERVQVGPLIYTILEVEWIGQINEGERPKLPNGKFAVIRLSITNSGNRDIAVPMLHLEDEKGAATMETTEVRGVDEWLGFLREIRPADTLQGRIVFDVGPKNYRLRITDAGTPDSERTALVAIPLRLEQVVPLPVDQPGAPDAPVPPPQ